MPCPGHHIVGGRGACRHGLGHDHLLRVMLAMLRGLDGAAGAVGICFNRLEGGMQGMWLQTNGPVSQRCKCEGTVSVGAGRGRCLDIACACGSGTRI